MILKSKIKVFSKNLIRRKQCDKRHILISPIKKNFFITNNNIQLIFSTSSFAQYLYMYSLIKISHRKRADAIPSALLIPPRIAHTNKQKQASRTTHLWPSYAYVTPDLPLL